MKFSNAQLVVGVLLLVLLPLCGRIDMYLGRGVSRRGYLDGERWKSLSAIRVGSCRILLLELYLQWIFFPFSNLELHHWAVITLLPIALAYPTLHLFDRHVTPYGLRWAFRGTFNEQAWHQCERERLPIYRLCAIGGALIIFLPFEHYWCHFKEGRLQDLIAKVIVIPEGGFPSPKHNPYELWEISVCLWSLLFLLVLVAYEFSSHMDNLQVKPGRAFQVGTASVLVVIFAGIWITYQLVFSHEPRGRLLAELSFAFLLCVIDWTFIILYRKNNGKPHLASDFGHFFLFLDFPTLIAFSVLYVYILREEPENWALPFVSGAAALSLVLVNLAFSFLYIYERYKDACVLSVRELPSGPLLATVSIDEPMTRNLPGLLGTTEEGATPLQDI